MFKRIPVSYLAYVSLLLAFVSLGVFVAFLATGSALAPVAGVSLAVFFGGAVLGFRAGGRTLAQNRDAVDAGATVSIFSAPLREDEVDHYLETHRTANTEREAGLYVIPGGSWTDVSVPSRLSA